jgi:predicted transcriptional regulator
MPLAAIETFEGKIMKMRALGYSQEEIAREMGITQSAVSQRIQGIRKKAQELGSDDKAFWGLLLGLGAAYLLSKVLEDE